MKFSLAQRHYFIFWIVCFVMLLGGCRGEEAVKVESEVFDRTQILPEDFLTPELVWKLILNESLDSSQFESKEATHDGHEKSSTLVNTESLDSYSIVFSTVDVLLEEKNPGVLKFPQIKISFPRGGGELDFKEYLTGRTGTFFVKFFSTSLNGKTSEDVLFWSRARMRRIESELHGSGCNKVLKMGSRWAKLNSKKGIEVNTHRDRYLSVIGGRFFFVSRKDKEIHLSQILLTHSDRKELLCEDKRGRE